MLLVATESNGTLNSFVTVLYTEIAMPTPASCTAPAFPPHSAKDVVNLQNACEEARN